MKVTKNSLILENIKAANLPQITVSQLNNFKSRYMKKININIGKSTSTLTEQIEWCRSGVDIPEDDDKAFCGGFEYELDENDELVV